MAVQRPPVPLRSPASRARPGVGVDVVHRVRVPGVPVAAGTVTGHRCQPLDDAEAEVAMWRNLAALARFALDSPPTLRIPAQRSRTGAHAEGLLFERWASKHRPPQNNRGGRA